MKTNIKDFIEDFDDIIKQKPHLEQMTAYALAHGLDKEDIKELKDRKKLTIVKKAMLFDELCHLYECGKLNKD